MTRIVNSEPASKHEVCDEKGIYMVIDGATAILFETMRKQMLAYVVRVAVMVSETRNQ